MGRNRDATTWGAIRSIYQQGGGGFPGVAAFWAGTGPKVLRHMLYYMLDPSHEHITGCFHTGSP